MLGSLHQAHPKPPQIIDIMDPACVVGVKLTQGGSCSFGGIAREMMQI